MENKLNMQLVDRFLFTESQLAYANYLQCQLQQQNRTAANECCVPAMMALSRRSS